MNNLYKEPDWAQPILLFPAKHKIHIIKDGQELESHRLAKTSWLVGRVPDCDLQMHHESVSRFHAVLQYGDFHGDTRKCWFVYDLGSTHGTRLDGMKIKPKEFIECRDGSVIRFGASSRSVVIHYPYTQPASKVSKTKVVIEKDVSVNSSVVKDPVITLENAPNELKKWLRSNGYDDELDIEISEQQNDYSISKDYYEEDSSSSKGKRKDLLGMLNLSVFTQDGENGFLKVTSNAQSKQILTQKLCLLMIDKLKDLMIFSTVNPVKRKQVEDDDFDSVGPDYKYLKSVNTYESLLDQKKDIEHELSNIRKHLSEQETVPVTPSENADDEDELEKFMSTINADLKLDTMERLKAKIQKIEVDIIELDELIEAAKPSLV